MILHVVVSQIICRLYASGAGCFRPCWVTSSIMLREILFQKASRSSYNTLNSCRTWQNMYVQWQILIICLNLRIRKIIWCPQKVLVHRFQWFAISSKKIQNEKEQIPKAQNVYYTLRTLFKLMPSCIIE